MSKFYKDPCPCKNCKDRKVGCHSHCDKYIQWSNDGVQIPKIEYIRRNKKKK